MVAVVGKWIVGRVLSSKALWGLCGVMRIKIRR